MKKIYSLILFLGVIYTSNAQFGFKKFFYSVGVTGKYMTADKYTGYDFNLTFVPRYNFWEINGENTVSIEARPQIGIGTRDWYIYREYEEVFPTRLSFALPVMINYNWGLNAEEDSDFVVGFYIGGGYNYSNVVSDTPPYDAIHGPVFDFGLRFDGEPVSHVSFMYTHGIDGGKIYSVGFYYDF
jgi:hypothetical protein